MNLNQYDNNSNLIRNSLIAGGVAATATTGVHFYDQHRSIKAFRNGNNKNHYHSINIKNKNISSFVNKAVKSNSDILDVVSKTGKYNKKYIIKNSLKVGIAFSFAYFAIGASINLIKKILPKFNK